MAKRTHNDILRILFDKDSGEFIFGNDITFDGQIKINNFAQTTPSKIWDITLTIDGVILFVFVYQDNEDGTFSMITPDIVKIVTEKKIIINFNEPVSGIVNILLSAESTNLI